MLACDISNYTDALTPGALQAWKDAGVGLVIVQAVDPSDGYPAGVTRQQIQACLDAGLTVDAYVWLWFGYPVGDIAEKLALLDGLAIRQVWLDVEDTSAVLYSQAATEAAVSAALIACDAYGTTSGQPTGVYSGRWFWVDPRYMGNTAAFSARELWDANYDQVADAAMGFQPYGGWDHATIKQYRGSTSLAGIGGIDLNVLSVAEAGEIDRSPDDPPQCDWGWVARKDEIVGLAGELKTVGDQIRAAGNRKNGPIRSDILPLADAVQSRANTILGG